MGFLSNIFGSGDDSVLGLAKKIKKLLENGPSEVNLTDNNIGEFQKLSQEIRDKYPDHFYSSCVWLFELTATRGVYVSGPGVDEMIKEYIVKTITLEGEYNPQSSEEKEVKRYFVRILNTCVDMANKNGIISV
ncbi:MAG: hypothetical protein IJL02_11455 [Methanobrevibacter sp.]|uniref:hypothetical protein n=1 Tax=Methanobrevibacter sp. TaxID=66852 RepID=UPI002600B142|nr:hypothetical protein [Methanobrevibacter sp.]MBQ6100462.1 hypothetical protein [Methanobrevibacter sp.]